VLREPERLVRAATRVEADLRRTTGRPWTCSVDSELVLTITDGVIARIVVLEREVEDEEWFVRPGANPAEVSAGLDADASELVGGEAAEAMTDLGLEWPVCPEHSRVLGSCSGWWYCDGPSPEDYHDVAEVGLLSAR
jgi:hypothetical protein